MYSLWGIALASLLVSAVHAQPPAAPGGVPPQRVVNIFTYKPLAQSGIPLVTVRLNNSTDATFVVDTGFLSVTPL